MNEKEKNQKYVLKVSVKYEKMRLSYVNISLILNLIIEKFGLVKWMISPEVNQLLRPMTYLLKVNIWAGKNVKNVPKKMLITTHIYFVGIYISIIKNETA